MPTLRVIFLHGISDIVLTANYAELLQIALLDRLREWQVVEPEWSAEQTAQVITFDTINYSSIGQAQEDAVWQSVEEDMKRLSGPLDRLLGKLALDQVRRQLVLAFSDALLYQSVYWRDKIREQLLKTITPYVGTGDSVTLIAHSLGSVVAFDVAYYNSRHNPDWLKAKFKPANLFTLGSPIALFSMEMDNANGENKPRYLPADSTPAYLDPKNTNPDLEPILDEGVWYNFFDAQDLIAYPLGTLFKDKFPVEDIVVQIATDPLKAHSGYWSNSEVADRIAQSLKFDYERMRRRENNQKDE